MKNFVYGLDLSLSNSGIAIFNEKGRPLNVFSIPTSAKLSIPKRLKTIADSLLETIDKYTPIVVVFESGFYRYVSSTQALYRVSGVAMYIFSDYPQYFYPPSTIKKTICGYGNATKGDVRERIIEAFPALNIENEDQSDAIGVGLTYFIQNRIIGKAFR